MKTATLALGLFPALAVAQAYRDPALPLEDRVTDLISRMTLEEKVGQMQHGAAAIPRLGVPAYNWWNEALHGVARSGIATVFPQSIGLGATFDRDLMHRVATAISDEARAKYHDAIRRNVREIYYGLTFWSPNINIFRDPRWGRGQETYGEDPYLTSRLGVEFVKGMQGDDRRYLKTIATAKHFAVHSGPEPLRNRFNAIATDEDLWLTYLPAFRALVTEAHVGSVMSAYNRVNGQPASGSPRLLEEILRKHWAFPGYVVSDCGAIYNIFQDHKVVQTAEEASALAVNSGCDLECGEAYQALVRAVRMGLISEATIDTSVRRLFTARMKLGMFDPDSMVPYASIQMSVVDSPKHRELALEAARKSIVLLKNKGGILPLSRAKTIAVIGPNADNVEVLLGNYNGTPSHAVTPLEGIRARARRVVYERGSGLTDLADMQPVPAEVVPRGWIAHYFMNMQVTGPPGLIRLDSQINFEWGEESPGSKVPKDKFSARWKGTLVPQVSGKYRLGIRNDDGMRVFVDGKKVLEDWSDHAPRVSSTEVVFEAGRSYEVVVEYYENGVGAVAQLLWSTPQKGPFEKAVQAAKRADVVVMALGISGDIENEGLDRESIELPQVQKDLLAAVKKTGKPIVLALVNGGPITLTNEESMVDAIVETWYGGEEAGTALADVLFGDHNPSGRMPMTVYKSIRDLPPFQDYRMKNRTYRYFKGEPEFPFGFGLSYTTFQYSNLKVDKVPYGHHGEPFLEIGVTVTNTGPRDGEEVIQVYLHDWEDAAGRRVMKTGIPAKELREFGRVFLRSGERKRVVLQVWDYAVPDLWWSGRLQVSVGGGQPGASRRSSNVLSTKVQCARPSF